jgi:hypothetical protein
MLTGGQKYRHDDDDDYDDNDNDNKLLQHPILKLMIIMMMLIMAIDSHNRCSLHIFARLVVMAHSINTIEG